MLDQLRQVFLSLSKRRKIDRDDIEAVKQILPKLSRPDSLYYAAFYAATAALNEVNLATKSHKGTHKLFYREYIDSAKIDSHHNQAFSRLFQNRQAADYTFGATFSPETALDAIEQAEAFVEAVAALLST